MSEAHDQGTYLILAMHRLSFYLFLPLSLSLLLPLRDAWYERNTDLEWYSSWAQTLRDQPGHSSTIYKEGQPIINRLSESNPHFAATFETDVTHSPSQTSLQTTKLHCQFLIKHWTMINKSKSLIRHPRSISLSMKCEVGTKLPGES